MVKIDRLKWPKSTKMDKINNNWHKSWQEMSRKSDSKDYKIRDQSTKWWHTFKLKLTCLLIQEEFEEVVCLVFWVAVQYSQTWSCLHYHFRWFSLTWEIVFFRCLALYFQPRARTDHPHWGRPYFCHLVKEFVDSCGIFRPDSVFDQSSEM